MQLRILFSSVLLAFILSFSTKAHAQFVAGFHHVPGTVFSDVYGINSFVSLGYEIGDRFIPELRLATNLDLEDYASGELALLYQIKNQEKLEIYTGLGFGYNGLSGVGTYALPIGLNMYPFQEKQFGFHIEFAPQVIGEAATIFRGSWGIRYRFAKE